MRSIAFMAALPHRSPSVSRIAVVGGLVFALNAGRFVGSTEQHRAGSSMITEERVFVAGAGPVGLVAAAALVRRGIPVTVFEASPTLSCESRASTFHPSTLD